MNDDIRSGESVNSKYLSKKNRRIDDPALEILRLLHREREIQAREESPSVTWLLLELSKKCGIKALFVVAVLTAITLRTLESQTYLRLSNNGFNSVTNDQSADSFFRNQNGKRFNLNPMVYKGSPSAARQEWSQSGLVGRQGNHQVGEDSTSTMNSSTWSQQLQLDSQTQYFKAPTAELKLASSDAGEAINTTEVAPFPIVPATGTNKPPISDTMVLSSKPNEAIETSSPTTPHSQKPTLPGSVTHPVHQSILDATPNLVSTVAPATSESNLASSPETKHNEGKGNKTDDVVLKLQNFKDNWDPYDRGDSPVFWHIAKSGGSTVKDIIGSCHHLVMASEVGEKNGFTNTTEIFVLDGSRFVNVDTTTIEGIQRAKAKGFSESRLAEVTVTPFLYEANDLFTATTKGRVFAVFRHPIKRAISMFYYLQMATWEPTYTPAMANWTIEHYAQSSLVENNWMTRMLSNHSLEGDILDDRPVNIALEVLRRKFLVGLLSDLDASMNRFEMFFRWKYHVYPENQESCRHQLLSRGSNSNNPKKREKPIPGSPVWKALVEQNHYDLRVYRYIETLYKEQSAFFLGLTASYRLVNATCCKCETAPTIPFEGFVCPPN